MGDLCSEGSGGGVEVGDDVKRRSELVEERRFEVDEGVDGAGTGG